LSKNGEISPGNNNIGTMQRAPHNHESSWMEELLRFRMFSSCAFYTIKPLGRGILRIRGHARRNALPLGLYLS